MNNSPQRPAKAAERLPLPRVAGMVIAAVIVAALLLLAAGAAHSSPPRAPLLRTSLPQRASRQPLAESGQRETIRGPWLAAAQVPWQRGEAAPADPLQLEPSRVLADLGITASQLEALPDGVPLAASDQELLATLLNRLPKLGPLIWHGWKPRAVPLGELQAAATGRGQVVEVSGRVTGVRPVPLLPEIAQRLEREQFFVVELECNDSPCKVEICLPAVPRVWLAKPQLPLGQAAAAQGFFLRQGPPTGNAPSLIIAAPRIQWYPRETGPGVSPSWVLLADLGLDVARFDELQGRNRKPLNAYDRESFYQLLHAASQLAVPQPPVPQGAVPQGAVPQGAVPQGVPRPQPFDLIKTLNHPQDLHGTYVRTEVMARNITRVAVPDRDIQQRFQLDHYYQIDCFIPLGEQTIRMVGRGDQDNITYNNTFPVTVCVTHLPESLRRAAEAVAAGETDVEVLDAQIEVTGFFFKLWRYRSEFTDRFNQEQLSPMLIASRITPIERSAPPTTLWGTAGGVIALAVIGGLWLLLWRFQRADDRGARGKQRSAGELEHLAHLDEVAQQPHPEEPPAHPEAPAHPGRGETTNDG